MYNLANLSTRPDIFIGKNKVDLVSQLITTQIISLPFLPLRSFDTKSIIISSQFHFGIERGCNSPISF